MKAIHLALCTALVVMTGCNNVTEESAPSLETISGSGLQMITINVPGMT